MFAFYLLMFFCHFRWDTWQIEHFHSIYTYHRFDKHRLSNDCKVCDIRDRPKESVDRCSAHRWLTSRETRNFHHRSAFYRTREGPAVQRDSVDCYHRDQWQPERSDWLVQCFKLRHSESVIQPEDGVQGATVGWQCWLHTGEWEIQFPVG